MARKISSHSLSSGPRPPSFSFYDYGISSSTPPSHIKTRSLPNQSLNNCSKDYNCVIFDIIDVSPEVFASQLTLLDLPIFLSIRSEELTSCAWTKKSEVKLAPNVVAFTRRFNHTSYWAVHEILCRKTSKQRADVLVHFIKIARKLYDLNNLHSLFAIISGLQSASIYRLSKTWSCVPKKDRQVFAKLVNIFSDSENWLNLRSHIKSLKLPCIPYLGLYLTDLVYVDMANPNSRGLESQQRKLKMNNILSIISSCQLSDYSHLTHIPHVQSYLKSVRYIEELQKFVDEDQYKLSLKLEPPSPVPSCSSKESIVTDGVPPTSLNLSPAKASNGSLRLHTAASGTKFIPGHRKCRSLGTNIFYKTHPETFEQEDIQRTHLLDDSELELSQVQADGHSPTSEIPLQPSLSMSEDSSLLTRLPDDGINIWDPFCLMQGCIRRKTVLKHGRKPTVSSWQRYWIQIYPSSLAYFSPKSFKGNQRSDFKSQPCKMVSLVGCKILLADATMHPDMFQITDIARDNVYKFRVESRSQAEKWCLYLQNAVDSNQASLPTNLMSFE